MKASFKQLLPSQVNKDNKKYCTFDIEFYNRIQSENNRMRSGLSYILNAFIYLNTYRHNEKAFKI